MQPENKVRPIEPSDESRTAYQLYGVLDNQTQVAERMNKELPSSHYYPFTQSKVSRLIKRYKKWLCVTNLPDVNEKPKARVEKVSPEFIEMGKRTDSSRATGSQRVEQIQVEPNTLHIPFIYAILILRIESN